MSPTPEALVATLVRLHGEHAAPTAGRVTAEVLARVWPDPRMVQAGVHRRAGTRRHRLVVTRPLS